MPTVLWLQLESSTELICGIISIILNLFLMYLILAKSPPRLGNYKYLMFYTSFFELIYAFINIGAAPCVYTYGSAFIVFRNLETSLFGHTMTIVTIVAYCSCFGFSMAVFGGHFIYRYGAINIDFNQKYLLGARQLLVFILPFVYGISWGLICWFYYNESTERTEYMRQTLLEDYRLNISHVAYISAHFWPKDENGQMKAHLNSFFGIFLMWIIMATSFYSVTYFGVKCYRKITQMLSASDNISKAAKLLQKQLFNALVIQAIIPVFLMYTPAGCVFLFPMCDLNIKMTYPFIGFTIAIYPAIDPLPTMLIVRSYREGAKDILGLLCCRRPGHRIGDMSAKVSATMRSIHNEVADSYIA